ncbi:hypothetical protein THAOC_21629 [Thalassiosira oceanica]|uniref:Uncharacterized protein n=1 Tax=Thalassiosira oceanica TaxID=159749 RepID=K0RWX8_THAOC|nr:hypothetical protein THAOC_21629 [Thalassiosira oceanica]|eukprot:EJK58263.1 hypothetical protein THAOC_21629 [Thalassiosira oceanica]
MCIARAAAPRSSVFAKPSRIVRRANVRCGRGCGPLSAKRGARESGTRVRAAEMAQLSHNKPIRAWSNLKEDPTEATPRVALKTWNRKKVGRQGRCDRIHLPYRNTTSARDREKMKSSHAAVAALSFAVLDSIDAFSLASRGHRGARYAKPQRAGSPRPSPAALKMSDLGSDFASAMPAKPELSMKEKLEESATVFIADIESRLADGVDAPPEIEALKEARDSPDSDEKLLALRIYELMIEQGMLYDIDAETGKLSLTNFDIKNNLDIPEVKAEFAHLYKYGMQLIGRELIDLETCKELVQKRLIDRTGLTPEEFDEWLGY